MKNLTAILCLTLTLLLGSMGKSFALPECDGSPKDGNDIFDETWIGDWDECVGTYFDKKSGVKFTSELIPSRDSCCDVRRI